MCLLLTCMEHIPSKVRRIIVDIGDNHVQRDAGVVGTGWIASLRDHDRRVGYDRPRVVSLDDQGVHGHIFMVQRS